jgi:hypothetical protein
MRANNIFISWSGKRSEWVAEALKDWLPTVIQTARPWLSTRDIEKGTRGLSEMNKALNGMGFGISCLTPENLDERWILFEAGALSKAFDDDKARLWTYLLADLQYQDVVAPLSQFQHTKAEKEDTRKLIHSINNAINAEEERLKESALNTIFDAMWPNLEKQLKTMPATEGPAKAKRGPNEIMTEILEMCRRYLPQLDELEYSGIPRSAMLPPTLGINPSIFAANAIPTFNPMLRIGLGIPPSGMRSRYSIKLKNDPRIRQVYGTSHLDGPGGTFTVFDGNDIAAKFENIEHWSVTPEVFNP